MFNFFKRNTTKSTIKKFKHTPLGLINIDNNAYMNSVIQCLFHLKKFREYFIKNHFSKEVQPLSCELSDIFKKLNFINGGKSFGLNFLKIMMGELDDSFLGSNGADSVDLLSYLFSTLITEQTNFVQLDLSLTSVLDISDEKQVFRDCSVDVGDDTALIYVMNYIEMIYSCGIKLKNISKYHDPFYSFEKKCYLEFDLEELIRKYRKNEFKLSECFTYFFKIKKREKSDEFCPECNKIIKCCSKINLYKTPEYLILVFNHKKNMKISINYSEYINIEPFTKDKEYYYRLVGVVMYKNDNSLAFSHYIACCLNSELNNEEQFYLFDDDKVYNFSFDKIKGLNYTPYILFYEKKSHFLKGNNHKQKSFIKFNYDKEEDDKDVTSIDNKIITKANGNNNNENIKKEILETEEEDTNGIISRNINETIDDGQDINSRKIEDNYDNNDNFDDSNYYDDNDFTDIKYITHGSYGDINSAYSKKDKIYLCLKHININQMREFYEKQNFTKSYENDLNNEIKLLKIFSSFENSLKYYGSYDKENEKIIVLEKCDEDLQLFMENRNKSLEIEKIKEILTRLNILFKEMHKRNIIQRFKIKKFFGKI